MPSTLLRVPTAKFKYNMRPFVEKARQGAKVIVTCGGKDDFEVLPCRTASAPPVLDGWIDKAKYQGVDLEEPAFESWEGKP